ncbi:MAG TPA: helix-turn-helix domain-containing protein [Pseudonocardia sp.]|jgi:predicted site-specific integrase-resolvase|nr:helix-turn-helix domain-containing protein [Pseudonocardia sp.]
MPGLAKQAQAQLAAKERDLMTPAEVAAELQISEKTLANQRSRRVGLPYVKVSGGIVRYSRKAVRECLAANTVEHGGAA